MRRRATIGIFLDYFDAVIGNQPDGIEADPEDPDKQKEGE